MAYKHHRVAVIIPAHNEQNSIGKVVSELSALTLGETRLVDDIIVCDNASSDDTAMKAKDAGARVVFEPVMGYGGACLKAIGALETQHTEAPQLVVFVDGDYSVKTSELPLLLAEIEKGADLVVGSRENSLLKKGALSIHQRFGNALASKLIRSIWKRSISDLGPFRAIRYSRLLELNMQDKRFGWTVEMQVKTFQAGFTYAEVPVTTQRRIGKSKISGTLKGTIGAALGIFGKIYHLYTKEQEFLESLNQASSLASYK